VSCTLTAICAFFFLTVEQNAMSTPVIANANYTEPAKRVLEPPDLYVRHEANIQTVHSGWYGESAGETHQGNPDYKGGTRHGQNGRGNNRSFCSAFNTTRST